MFHERSDLYSAHRIKRCSEGSPRLSSTSIRSRSKMEERKTQMRENNTLKTSQQISTRNSERRKLLLDLPKQPPKMPKKWTAAATKYEIKRTSIEKEEAMGWGGERRRLIYWAQSEGHVSSFPLYNWENGYTLLFPSCSQD